jgi:hypothetical protein
MDAELRLEPPAIKAPMTPMIRSPTMPITGALQDSAEQLYDNNANHEYDEETFA